MMILFVFSCSMYTIALTDYYYYKEKKIDEFMKLDNDRCKKEKIWNLS